MYGIWKKANLIAIQAFGAIEMNRAISCARAMRSVAIIPKKLKRKIFRNRLKMKRHKSGGITILFLVKNPLLAALYNHFQTYFKADCVPVLLALSGGSDSRALFETLKLLPQKIDLHIAHVDHGWRKDSKEQAENLAELCSKYPFHLKRLEKMEGSNLEDRARIERYAFFKELQNRYNYQGILLAHHAGDLAETVLKRILEGSEKLSAMQTAQEREGMTLWRPWLSVTKEQILSFVDQYIDDPTNRDTRFLRARMRLQILPELERQFGKNIQKNLCHLSERFAEIEADLDCRISDLMPYIGESEVPLTLFEGKSKLEIKHFLRRWQKELSREGASTLAELILKKQWHGEVSCGRKSLRLFKDKFSLVCYTRQTASSAAENI